MPNPEVSTFDPNGLVVNDYPIKHKPVTYAAGEVVSRGAAIGRVTASGEYKKSVAGAGDGSEVPAAIAAEDVDATAGAVMGPAYFSGSYDADMVAAATSPMTAAVIEDAFRAVAAPLFLETRR